MQRGGTATAKIFGHDKTPRARLSRSKETHARLEPLEQDDQFATIDNMTKPLTRPASSGFHSSQSYDTLSLTASAAGGILWPHLPSAISTTTS
jgi:hypothetical protein